ncbi:MAG: hypothetical protein ACK5TH_22035, partial [Prosthecobacter sp.]
MSFPTIPFARGLLQLCVLITAVFCATEQVYGQVPTSPTVTSASFSYVASDTTGFLVNWVDNSTNETSFVVAANT